MLPEDQPAMDPMDDLMNYRPSSYNKPGNNSDEDEEDPIESSQNIIVDIVDILQCTW